MSKYSYRTICPLLVFFALCLLPSACSATNNPLLGKWEVLSVEHHSFYFEFGNVKPGDIVEFRQDNTALSAGKQWNIKLIDQNRIGIESFGQNVIYEFNTSNGELTLKGGGDDTMIKLKKK